MSDPALMKVVRRGCPFLRLTRPSWDQRKKILRREAWIFVVVVYLLLAFAYLWPADFRNNSPTYVWISWAAFIIRTYLVPLGVTVAVAMGLAALGREWRLCLSILPLLIITLGPLAPHYIPKQVSAVAGETVVVMSVNLLMINKNTPATIDEIRAANPEVLLLQEYTRHWHHALQAAIGKDYPFAEYRIREDSFGMAVYSKRPFEEPVSLDLPLASASVPQARAALMLNGELTAIYNIHFLPPSGLTNIIEHRLQFADLAQMLATETLHVILGGDFNFTCSSPQGAALRKLGLRDTHALAGRGRGTTWPRVPSLWWMPSLRLDHIYIGGGLTCIDAKVGVGRGSDHSPVSARIGFRPR